MRVISLVGASSVTDPETRVEHEAGPDRVFDLPEPFAQYLTTKHASLWRAESHHEAATRAAAVDELRNPHVVPSVLADLRERVAVLEAQVVQLLQLAAAAPETEPESAGKGGRGRKSVPARPAKPTKPAEPPVEQQDENSGASDSPE